MHLCYVSHCATFGDEEPAWLQHSHAAGNGTLTRAGVTLDPVQGGVGEDFVERGVRKAGLLEEIAAVNQVRGDGRVVGAKSWEHVRGRVNADYGVNLGGEVGG
jgi:hypothetical protein